MSNIKHISALRNYTEVLKEVDTTGRVYLTRNGHCEYGILTMEEIDELNRNKVAYTLISKLLKADERADKEGWIDEDMLEVTVSQYKPEVCEAMEEANIISKNPNTKRYSNFSDAMEGIDSCI